MIYSNVVYSFLHHYHTLQFFFVSTFNLYQSIPIRMALSNMVLMVPTVLLWVPHTLKLSNPNLKSFLTNNSCFFLILACKLCSPFELLCIKYSLNVAKLCTLFFSFCFDCIYTHAHTLLNQIDKKMSLISSFV